MKLAAIKECSNLVDQVRHAEFQYDMVCELPFGTLEFADDKSKRITFDGGDLLEEIRTLVKKYLQKQINQLNELIEEKLV